MRRAGPATRACSPWRSTSRERSTARGSTSRGSSRSATCLAGRLQGRVGHLGSSVHGPSSDGARGPPQVVAQHRPPQRQRLKLAGTFNQLDLGNVAAIEWKYRERVRGGEGGPSSAGGGGRRPVHHQRRDGHLRGPVARRRDDLLRPGARGARQPRARARARGADAEAGEEGAGGAPAHAAPAARGHPRRRRARRREEAMKEFGPWDSGRHRSPVQRAPPGLSGDAGRAPQPPLAPAGRSSPSTEGAPRRQGSQPPDRAALPTPVWVG